MAKKLRTIITPVIADLSVKDGPLTYWKQILPEQQIQYDADGTRHVLKFDRRFHDDVIKAFKAKAIDQTCFQLANSNNEHGRDYDPERQRGDVTEMRRWDELPADVQQAIVAQEGEPKPGVYGKINFWSKKAAKSVAQNPKLGVSARVRENFTRADGTFVKRAIIHVLGTVDPRVTGMASWQPADLSYDADNGIILDLSNTSYRGSKMAKSATKTKTTTEAGDDTEARIPTRAEIDAMSEDEIDAFLADANGGEPLGDTTDDDDDTDDDDTDDDDTDDDDTDDDDTGADDRTLATTGASLSNAQRRSSRAIDLANAAAQRADKRAREALRRQGLAEWKAERAELLRAGVPVNVLDLAAPVLSRPDDMVIDLSNEGGSDLNTSKILRELIDQFKGTVPFDEEAGHGGSVDLANGDTDPDAEALAAWEELTPLGLVTTTD